MRPHDACRRITDLLPAYASGTLDQRETAVVWSHLAVCPVCSAELTAWKAIREAARAAAPASAASPDVLARVMDAIGQMERMRPASSRRRWLVTGPPSAGPAASGPARGWRPLAGNPSRWWPALELAMMVVLIVALVGSLLATGRFFPDLGNRRGTAAVPAARMSNDVLIEVDLDVTSAPPTRLTLYRLTLAPDGSTAWDAGAGPALLVVDTGVVTVRVDGEAMVRRPSAGGPASPIAVSTGSDISLQAGDRIALPLAAYELRNAGTTPATVLGLVVQRPGPPLRVSDDVMLETLAAPPPMAMPAERVTVTLARHTLAAESGELSPLITGPSLIYVESGRLWLEPASGNPPRLLAGGTDANEAMETEAVSAAVQVVPGDAVLVEVESVAAATAAGDEPTVFLEARVTPVAATPVSATPGELDVAAAVGARLSPLDPAVTRGAWTLSP